MKQEAIPNKASDPQLIPYTQAQVKEIENKGWVFNPYYTLHELAFFNRLYTREFCLKILIQGENNPPTKLDYTPFGAFMGARVTLVKSLGISYTEQVADELYEQAWIDWNAA